MIEFLFVMVENAENRFYFQQREQEEKRKNVRRQIIEIMSGPALLISDITPLSLLRPPQPYMENVKAVKADEFDGLSLVEKGAILEWRNAHKSMERDAKKLLGNALAGIVHTRSLSVVGQLRAIDEQGLHDIGEIHRRNSTRVGHRRGGGLNKDRITILKALFPSSED